MNKWLNESISRLRTESFAFIISVVVAISILTTISVIETIYSSTALFPNVAFQSLVPYMIVASFVIMFIMMFAYWKIFNGNIVDMRKSLPEKLTNKFDSVVLDIKIGILFSVFISVVIVVLLALNLSIEFGILALISVSILWSFNLPDKEFKAIEEALCKSIEKSSDIF